ncbi:ferrous iron transporter B [Sedimentibacter sp. MB31-C6]|uniref:ferrous iron transporter B n=1 Tax=Sedimentibacter sp. MB31-C6 TaxID=3109366 RepID=UPI002DDD21FE|nr:ferrous iron transporter B [Sedimentibacter sp. MB36-C1]WSI05090.1 ferrous iron transporter B [Sedimentibacter sp. MB36-C1]
MGLTAQSIKKEAMEDIYKISKSDNQHVIALAGNPNTGKSTVFNYLTGLKQHTGNWPGKTVVTARGEYQYNNEDYIMVDLPGSYSLFTSSKDEEVARDFTCSGNYDAIVVVADATCLERNLNLVFQIMELSPKVILCINLIDEARNKNISLKKDDLEKELGIPIVLTAARSGEGMEDLKRVIEDIAVNNIEYKPNIIRYDNEIENKLEEIIPVLKEMNISNLRWNGLRLIDSEPCIFSSQSDKHLTKNQADELINKFNLNENKYIIREKISEINYNYANNLKQKYVIEDYKKNNRDKKIDDIITSKRFGIPIMLGLLGLIFWITIQGANIPSQIISNILFKIQDYLSGLFIELRVPEFIRGIFIDGMYRTLAWVVSVMLPPMAIFFPLFTLLEDLGYLPRVAFNLDHLFKKACAHGKQSLSMCMG